MKNLYLSLFSALFLFSALCSDRPDGKNIYMTGHSFLLAKGYAVKKLDILANGAEITKHKIVDWNYAGGRNGAVDKWWSKGSDKNPRKAITASQVDILLICIHFPKEGGPQEKAILNFAKLMLKHNPKGKIYLVATHAPNDGNMHGGWNARTKLELIGLEFTYTIYYKRLIDKMNSQIGQILIEEIPLYSAQNNARKMILEGKLPGVTKQSELYKDAMGHLSEIGERLHAYTIYASIYKHSPIGLSTTEWETTPEEKVLNEALQKAAWQAVNK
ncbi:MAG: hypothetical protein MK193_04965 [Lentisphaeria bacterium]|nr:hypothetical protein [Lentisphaeria bacterium]